jgi:hypothetical protein
VSTHALPHVVSPPAQLAWHSPMLQKTPGGHSMPHMPQLNGSVCVLVHVTPHISRG